MTSCYLQVAETQLIAVKDEYESAKAQMTQMQGERDELSGKVLATILS